MTDDTEAEPFPELRDPAPEGYPFGIIDPDYGRAYSIMRIVCWQYGYSLALQGSMTRDLDVVAIPWTKLAVPPEALVHQIADRTKTRMQSKEPTLKEHGRMSWTLFFPGFEDPRWIDFSAMPRIIPIKKEETNVLPSRTN